MNNKRLKTEHKTTKKSHQIQLNSQEWNQLMELLDTPPEPNEKLKQAMQIHWQVQS